MVEVTDGPQKNEPTNLLVDIDSNLDFVKRNLELMCNVNEDKKNTKLFLTEFDKWNVINNNLLQTRDLLKVSSNDKSTVLNLFFNFVIFFKRFKLYRVT